MTETAGKSLANFMGELIEYDAKNTSNFWMAYMRVKVLLDVRTPLRRGEIKKQGGEASIVSPKYERLDVYFYLCGMLGAF